MPAPDRKRRLTAFAVAMAVLIATPLAVVAADAFNDVPTSNVHHDDITWLRDADVTRGCNPPANTEFCPGDPVLRQQMASFMRRLAENQVVDAATAIDAEHATTADSAATANSAASADNADQLDGNDAADLMSHAQAVQDDGFIALPGGATTEALSLELEPGSYLLIATGVLNNNAGTDQSASCTFSAGTASASTGTYVLDPVSGPGDREGWTLTLATTLGSTASAVISCSTSAGFSGNLGLPQISAISVQGASAEVLSTASGSDGEG